MRRAIDIAVAGTAFVVLSPVTALVAVLVRWRLGSPVIFRQRRTGLNGREFEIVKFRTMRPKAWPGEPDADRDTRLGRILRGLSLDELPQLSNIVIGDMSLIGPRPTLPEQVVHYSRRQHGPVSLPGPHHPRRVRGRSHSTHPRHGRHHRGARRDNLPAAHGFELAR